METSQRPDLSELLKELPPWVSRKHPRFRELTGYSPRSLANMDSLGLTKTVQKVMMGGAVCYNRESLVAWLEQRSKVIA